MLSHYIIFKRIDSQQEGSHMKPWKIIVIVIAVVVVAIVGYVFLTGFIGTSNPATTQTWSQYGMSMQYPSGLQAKYKGVFEQQATSDSGTVYWVWNQTKTTLALTWVHTPSFSYSAGFDGIYDLLCSIATNVTLIGQGTTTMAGSTWQYQTYQYNQVGLINYESCAIYFDSTNGRAFEIDFVDTNPTTLNSLIVYGNTFTR